MLLHTRFVLVALTMAALLGAGGCGPATFVVGVAPGGQQLVSTVVERDGRWGSQRVAVIEVSGMIANADQAGLLSKGENPVATLAEALRAAGGDAQVASVILRINSPGGTVTASDMMYREVKRFREDTGKPVVVLMADVAASGGYYLACASDHIIAHPTTITGSIGVVFQTFSVRPALDKIGVRTEALVSGPNKTAGSPLENLDQSQREILQGLVDDFYADFVAIVRDSRRGVDPNTWGIITDGRVFTGERAHELGLVDQLGDVRDAFAKAKELAGLQHADLVVYHRPLDYVATPLGSSPVGSGMNPREVQTQVNLMQVNLGRSLPTGNAGVYYLWLPELK